jgi:hypothetical protein
MRARTSSLRREYNMARRKSSAAKRSRRNTSEADVRRYRTRGVEVEIKQTNLGLRGARAADNHVELTLDGKPIDVEMVDGKYHSQLANQFTAFDSIDEVVDTLLANEGRTWTLHGHFCDERCGPGGHHHGGGHAPGHDHDHGEGGHDHGPHHRGGRR